MFLSSRRPYSILFFVDSRITISEAALFFCLSWLYCVFPVQAQDMIVLDREIEIGSPRFTHARYVFSAEDQSQGVLRVTGNLSDKSYSGFVWCNGKWYTVDSDHPLVRDFILKSTNRLLIVLFGDRGASLRISILQTENHPPPPEVTIQKPLNGDTTVRGDVMVRGTIDNPLGTETGVRINEIMAMVVGNEFAANHVPMKEGWNTITVEATDIKGNTATASVMIAAAPEDKSIWITAARESGISPLETSLSVDGAFHIAAHTLSHTGPGVVDVLPASPESYKVKMTTPGLYFFTAEALDDQNKTYTDTIAIAVVDPVRVDTLCRSKWDDMKSALINGDIEQALTCHHGSSRTRYTTIYNAVGDDLPSLARQMREISPVMLDDTHAKYRIKQDHEIEGQNVTISYYIYFSQDEDGLWRIEKY